MPYRKGFSVSSLYNIGVQHTPLPSSERGIMQFITWQNVIFNGKS